MFHINLLSKSTVNNSKDSVNVNGFTLYCNTSLHVSSDYKMLVKWEDEKVAKNVKFTKHGSYCIRVKSYFNY